MGQQSVRSACPYCGVGCGVVLDVDDGRIVRISGDKAHPANRGRLCTKGKTAHEAVQAPGRLGAASVRGEKGGVAAPVAMTEAIRMTAARLRAIIDRDGPDAVALYVSGQMSLEAQYLANKLAKGFIRTAHIESNSRLCMASAGTGYKLSLGADAPPGSYDDFDHADLFLVLGANMADCHPILFLRMMDRVAKGAKLIVVDPRVSATAEKAHLHLRPRPGTDLALLNGLLHLIVEAGAIDRDFIARHTAGWEDMPGFLAGYGPDAVAEMTGLAAGDIRKAAAMIVEAGAFMSLWTMGLNQSVEGTFNTNAICNLHLATGKIARLGSGPFSLTGQPNAMGGREMGYMGAGLPGQRSALVTADRAFCEARWGLAEGTIRAEAGLGTIGLFDAVGAGVVKAIWIICTNPVASVAGSNAVRKALQKAELVIVQDIFAETETTAFADILLPAASSFEADGVVVNSERNMTLTRAAIAPPGEAMPDWRIIAEVAKAMGFCEGFSFETAAEVFAEAATFSNPLTDYDISGASHARLAETPMQWPVSADNPAPRHPLRYRTADGGYRFATADGRARFLPRVHVGPAERPDEDFPFILNTGRLQHQWHTMTRTGKVAALNRLNPAPFVEIHPRDAARLGIASGDSVAIVSRRGRAVLPAEVSDRVVEGSLFAPLHWNDLFGEGTSINAVTSDATDPLSLQPAFKIAAVRLEKVAGKKVTATIPALKPELKGIAQAIGLADPLPLDDAARQWLGGFLVGLGARRETAMPVVPDDAPLSPPARIIVSGLLAGLYAKSAEPDAKGETLYVLYASQTGTAEGIAAGLAEAAKAGGKRVRLAALNDMSMEMLAKAEHAIIIAATFGDGDPPDNAVRFWTALEKAGPSLTRLAYRVVGLGDSSYARFCGFGERLDARLAELGANRLGPFAPSDAGDEDKAAASALEALRIIGKPGSDNANSGFGSPAPVKSRHRAPLVVNRLLSRAGGGKEVRQFGFRFDEAYQAGDALSVMPENCPELVDELLSALSFDPAAPVETKAGAMPMGEALLRSFEIAQPTPAFLRWWAKRSGADELRRIVETEDRPARDRWLWGRHLADIVQRYPARVAPDDFVAELRPLKPRLYSIASSAKAHPGEVHLTVSVIRHAHHGRPRKGVASSFLADRAGHADILVQSQPHFRPPEAGDAIMVGPGTGIAPFRAFLQEREALGQSGRNWLFFGEQNRAGGFYYEDELLVWLKSGHLTRLDTAFSRDQAQKIYVQHRMLEQGAELWAWLQDGASFYVCGDAARMAKDVEAALLAIAGTHGGLSEDDARDWLQALSAERRYQRDVY